MISLRQFLNQGDVRETAASDALPEESSEGARDPDEWKNAWRSLLFTVNDSAARAIPPLGPALSQELSALGHKAIAASGEDAAIVNGAVCRELGRWSDEAGKFYSEHQKELKEIVSVVARTAESIGQRDGRFTDELSVFAIKLRTVADQTEMGVIRRSIIESAGVVQSCVARMAKEGRETVRQLTEQAEEYRRRMEEAERISLVDPLTGLLNRRGLDRELARRMAEGKPLCVTLLDLDEFKVINDNFGHPAGDDLLRQLSVQMTSQFVPPRMVARLGGDEFVVVMQGPATEAEKVAVKIRSWVLGKYRISDGRSNKIEVNVQGSLGSTSWNGKESAETLLARADELMYQTKPPRGLSKTAQKMAAEPSLAGAIRS